MEKCGKEIRDEQNDFQRQQGVVGAPEDIEFLHERGQLVGADQKSEKTYHDKNRRRRQIGRKHRPVPKRLYGQGSVASGDHTIDPLFAARPRHDDHRLLWPLSLLDTQNDVITAQNENGSREDQVLSRAPPAGETELMTDGRAG